MAKPRRKEKRRWPRQVVPMPIRSIQEEFAMLAQLESFSPGVFRGDSEVPQALCNFVLTLALIYNDCKNAIFAHVALAGARPAGRPQKTRALGAASGIQFHAFRTVAASVHEMLDLIDKNRALLDHPSFVSLLQQLRPKSRRAWQALVDVACGAEPTDQLTKNISRLRHKILSHYDPPEIFRGYSQHFLGAARRDERAYVSRGDTMRTTRFYFADAAGTGYLDFLVGRHQAEKLRLDLAEIIDQINQGLMMIVMAFIHQRGGPLQRETEP
jgi:hypothetical protein